VRKRKEGGGGREGKMGREEKRAILRENERKIERERESCRVDRRDKSFMLARCVAILPVGGGGGRGGGRFPLNRKIKDWVFFTAFVASEEICSATLILSYK